MIAWPLRSFSVPERGCPRRYLEQIFTRTHSNPHPHGAPWVSETSVIVPRHRHRGRAENSERDSAPDPITVAERQCLMSTAQHSALLVRIEATTALDRADDPRALLGCSGQHPTGSLTQVRQSPTDVATKRERLTLQIDHLQQCDDRLESRAVRAIAAGCDEVAREALTRRAAVARTRSSNCNRSGTCSKPRTTRSPPPSTAADRIGAFSHSHANAQGFRTAEVSCVWAKTSHSPGAVFRMGNRT